MIDPLGGFIIKGEAGLKFSKDTRISWSTDAISTLSKAVVGKNKRFMIVIVLIKPRLLEKGDEIEVTVGECAGIVKVKAF